MTDTLLDVLKYSQSGTTPIDCTWVWKNRRRKGLKRPRVLVKLRNRQQHSPLPSILLANAKLDELRPVKDCNVFHFTETWVDPTVSDLTIVPMDLSVLSITVRTVQSWVSAGELMCA